MNFRFINISILQLFLALLVSGCATPTISDTIMMKQVGPDRYLSKSISKSYLLGGGGLDWANKVICKKDGSCVLFGYSIKSFGESTDFLAVKISSTNEIVWAKAYGAKHKDRLYDVIQMSDGGYFLLGGSHSMFYTPMPGFYEYARPLMLRISSNGNVEWAYTIEEIDNQRLVNIGETYLPNGVQTEDEGYVLAGTSFGKFIMVKFSKTNQFLWAFHYDFGFTSIGYAVTEGKDGSLFVSGRTSENDKEDDLILLKTNKDGKPLSAMIFKAEGGQEPNSMLTDKAGDLVIIGFITNLEEEAIFITKTSSSNSLHWAFSYDCNAIWSTVLGHSDDYLVVGRRGVDPDSDAIALLVDNNGEFKSSLIIDGTESDEFVSSFPLSNGEYILFGTTANFELRNIDMKLMTWKAPKKTNQDNNRNIFIKKPLTFEKSRLQVKRIPVRINIKEVPIGTATPFEVLDLKFKVSRINQN